MGLQAGPLDSAGPLIVTLTLSDNAVAQRLALTAQAVVLTPRGLVLTPPGSVAPLTMSTTSAHLPTKNHVTSHEGDGREEAAASIRKPRSKDAMAHDWAFVWATLKADNTSPSLS